MLLLVPLRGGLLGAARFVSHPLLSAKTAMASSPESATSSRQPSLVTVSAMGWVPTSACSLT